MESLEPRQFLSFTPFGRPIVAGGGVVREDIAAAGDGSFYVAAIGRHESPSLHRVISQLAVTHYAANGRQSGTPLVLSNYIDPLSTVSIAADAAGDAVVSYIDYRSGGDVVSYALVQNNAVAHRGTVERIAGVTGTISQTAAAMDAAGDFYVGWAEPYIINNKSNGGDRLVIDRFAAGQPDHAAAQVVPIAASKSSPLHIQSGLDLAARPDGSGVVYAAAVSGDVITGQSTLFFNNIRTGVISDDAVTSDAVLGDPPGASGSSAYLPSIEVAADHSFVIGYLLRPTGDVSTAYAQRFNTAGVSTGANLLLGRDADDVHLAAMPDGGFAASVSLVRNHLHNIFATRYSAAGTADESGAILISSNDGLALSNISTDSAGNATVATLSQSLVVSLRRLTSGVAVDGRELYVIGTGGRDQLSVSATHSRVVVMRNGVVSSFPKAKIAAVSIGGLAGNDSLTNNTALPGFLFGGTGHDTAAGNVDDTYFSIEERV